MNQTDTIKPNSMQQYNNLVGSSLGLAISSQLKSDSFHLIITPDNLTSRQLRDELQFFCGNDSEIDRFPDWETLPYDNLSPHEDIISKRLELLYRLPQRQSGILIISIASLMHKLAPNNKMLAFCFAIKVGDKLNLTHFRAQLTDGNYVHVTQVINHGEFSIRGSIIDIFPMGSEKPLRIDLFDNEVDSIRQFDPDTQLSEQPINVFDILPAREFTGDDESIELFRTKWRKQFPGDPNNCELYKTVSQGYAAQGIEYYLPLFYEQMHTLFDYLPKNTTIFYLDECHSKAEHFWHNVQDRYDQLSHDTQNPILLPTQLFIQTTDIFHHIKQFERIQYKRDIDNSNNYPCEKLPDLIISHKTDRPLAKLSEYIKNSSSTRILFCTETAGLQESLIDMLHKIKVLPTKVTSWQAFIANSARHCICISPISTGFYLTDDRLAIISETHLFGKQVSQRHARKTDPLKAEQVIRHFCELTIGDAVVHIEHGIGRYLGLETITTHGKQDEYLLIEYDNASKLFVPMTSLHLISRYTGSDTETVALNRLGSSQWEKAKKRAAQKAIDAAAELLDIYARRAARPGFACNSLTADYQTFARSFPFEETPDQQAAIDDVVADMTSKKVMDRLVCGDVGFGKTEVAMRAAFVCVQSNKQVMVLVPSTILADQHTQSFQDRFADWPVKVASLTRFKTKKEQEAILQDLAIGKIDIIVGTHKLLQKDIKYKSLGLLIIDEEHRFGVRQKEQIRSHKSNIDTLTLTATPIPRTLNLAMSGLRDLSIIATPPAKRLSIKTFIQRHNSHRIQEAIRREVMRGGQVFYIHNTVRSLPATTEKLKELLPDIDIRFAHGQMSERQLEKIMTDFYHQRFQVLVVTTIVESGIDVPTANTIIIDRADRFGLAQLHQLRGRVGRSHHQAYAYLLTPEPKVMTRDAVKRLDALDSLEDLGAGFSLATHDLEIRGAGELLGDEQSGHIQTVGFDLYMEMLEQAVADIKAGKIPNLDKPMHQGFEMNLHCSTIIPESYIHHTQTRLIFYKRIANAKNKSELDALKIELIDRFGLLPDPVNNLFKATHIKLLIANIDIRKINIGSEQGYIQFGPKPLINLRALLEMVQKNPREYQLDNKNKLKFNRTMEDLDQKLQWIEMVINTIKT